MDLEPLAVLPLEAHLEPTVTTARRGGLLVDDGRVLELRST
jgi:hypothetical protein